MSHYTYMWLRKDGTPYYVGKGTGNRAFFRHERSFSPPKEKDRTILQVWDSENEAYEAERFLITFYGRKDLETGCLRNLTDGGDGGFTVSDEVRCRISRSLLGNRNGSGNKGGRRSDEVRRKMSRSHFGKGGWAKGKSWTPARREAQIRKQQS